MKQKQEPMNHGNGFCHPSPTPPMLINEIARLFHAKMRSFETDRLLSQDSIRLILRELGHGDGCSQLDLVQKTHLKPPTVSVTLKKLEDEGLVQRVQDPLDMRVTRVYLSEKGRAHHKAVHEHLSCLDTTLMQGFTEEETACLLQFLVRMRNNILPENCKNNPLEEQEKTAKN